MSYDISIISYSVLLWSFWRSYNRQTGYGWHAAGSGWCLCTVKGSFDTRESAHVGFLFGAVHEWVHDHGVTHFLGWNERFAVLERRIRLLLGPGSLGQCSAILFGSRHDFL
jgi:hypothetical protein